MARDLYSVGAMSEVTMRQMDVLCLLSKRRITADDISRIQPVKQKPNPE